MGNIYLITNKINGKKYVGQTKNSIGRRFTEHKRDAKQHAYDSILHSAMLKYGFENFEMSLLEGNIPNEDLNDKEKEWIEKCNSFVENGQGYNLTKGGQQNTIVSQSTKEKHRYNALHGITGHKHLPREQVYTKEVREKISKGNKNKVMSKESKEKISVSLKGRKLSTETKEKLRQINIGRRHTEETKEKLSIIKKEFLSNKENHNFYGKKGKDSSRHNTIYQYDENWNLVNVFGCQLEALAYLNTKGHTAMNKAIKNKILYKGYYWTKEDVETIEIIHENEEESRVAS